MTCRNCLDRRAFLERAAGGLLAAGAIACGDGVISGTSAAVPRLPPNQPPTGRVTIVVADFPALAQNGVLVKVSTFYAAKRTGATSFEAFSMACTHEGCLTDIVGGQQFDCPCHGSRFASDGAVLAGPARQPLQRLTASYDPTTDILTIN